MDYKEIEIGGNTEVYGNTETRELDIEPQNIPQGVKPELNPNPGYGEDGKTKPAIRTVPVKGEVEVDGGVITDQKGIRVERVPVNFVNGLYVNGKPVETSEQGSDDSNVYRFNEGDELTTEIAALLKSGDVILVNNMAFTINKINSDHAWFRGFYTDGSVEGKVSVAHLEWEENEPLNIEWNEISGGTKLYLHRYVIMENVSSIFLICNKATPLSYQDNSVVVSGYSNYIIYDNVSYYHCNIYNASVNNQNVLSISFYGKKNQETTINEYSIVLRNLTPIITEL